MKYTRKDVIIDPDDVRLEIGAEYFAANSIGTALDFANRGQYDLLVDLVDIIDEDSPFLVVSNEDNYFVDFLIRRKEPENKYIPFDLSLEEDRAKIRGAWIKSNEDLDKVQNVCGVCSEYVYLSCQAQGYSAEDFLEGFTFLDGTPCGKLVEIEE